MRQRGAAAVTTKHSTEARAERDRADEGDRPADAVHDRGPCKVTEGRGHDGQPAIRSPSAVTDDGIDEPRDADAVQNVADEPVARLEHERKAPGPEREAADARVHDAFDQNVDRLARSREAGFEHDESNLHAEYEKRREQHPHRVQGVDQATGRRSGRAPPEGGRCSSH